MASLPLPQRSTPTSDPEKAPEKATMEASSERPSLNRSVDPRNSSMDDEFEPPVSYQPGQMITLSDTDHAYICHAIGACSDHESHALLHPTSVWYPPKGLPNGLYRDVIHSRAFCAYQFYFTMICFNVSLLMQLILGATTTALASTGKSHTTSLTVLAAMNTVNAGVLALMHNSGLPDRYKNDWVEYEKVEMCLKALIDGAVVQKGLSKEDVIADCYERFAKAKDTVEKNKPSAYTATAQPQNPGPAKN